MLYPTAGNWKEWNITGEVHQFFTLHWDELFDDGTPDTWQVRTCNVPIILDEIITASRTARRIDRHRKVLEDLVAEATKVAKRDPVIRSKYPFVEAYLKPWKDAPSASQLKAIEHMAQVLKGNLRDYSAACVTVVREGLEAADPKKKLDLYDSTMSLAVDVATKGYSTDHIQSVFRERITTPTGDNFLDRYDKMMADLDGEALEYKCTFLARGLQKPTTTISLPNDLTAHEGPARTPTDPTEIDFYKRGYVKDVNVTVTCKAVDSTTARHISYQRVSELFATHNLYGVEEEYGIKVDDALVCGPSNKFQVVSPTESRLKYLSNAKGMHWKVEKLLGTHSRLLQTHRDDAAQLMASLHYHRLAMSATSDEARLVNLWVALESLCQQGDDSIINRVCAKTSPCVASGNVRKTLTNMAIYIRYFWDEKNFADFQSLFPNAKRSESSSRLPIEDLLTVLMKDAKSPEVLDLFKLISSHSLICHRLFRVKGRLLNEPSSVAKGMESHAKNVDWQLRRIYRVRNEIVHRGQTVSYLRQLIQHLHSYLVIVLQSLIYQLSRQPQWGIDDALQHQKLLYEHAVSLLKESGDISISTLLNTEDFLVTQQPPFAWVTPPATA